MDNKALFAAALGLTSPWKVTELKFDPDGKRLDLRVDFPPGSLFACPECGTPCKVHDTAEHTWRHLSFFQHGTYVTARQPRTSCPVHGVKQSAVPWARPGSSFTLLFEAFVIELVREDMPVRAAGRILGEYDTRLWRIIDHYVRDALARLDLSALANVGVDETSRAKGHSYVTLFVDMATHKVVFIASGKDQTTVAEFRDWIKGHRGQPETVREFSLDMSQAFIAGIQSAFPEAAVTFDKFHVIALASKAIDAVRREEQKSVPELKKSRHAFLKNAENRTVAQQQTYDAVKGVAKKTTRAYGYRELLQGLYKQESRAAGEAYLESWLRSALRTPLEPIKKLARTVRQHREGILRWFESKLNNGVLEGINSLVQSAKRIARGFRNPDYLATIIYLRHGGIDLKLPSLLPMGAVHAK